MDWTLAWVFATFALYIGIAVWARAGSTNDFYVAGHGVHPVVNGMATAADWMSAASFLSMAGLIAGLGYGGSVYLMGWTGGYVLLALLLAPFLREFGKFTVPDFVGDRYYSDAARVVAVICALFVSFTYIAGQMSGVGLAFSRFLGVDFNTGIFVGMGIVFVYAVLGGMKGVTYTQVAQYCVLIFAYTVPAIFISLMLTGNPVPQLGFISDIKGEGVSMLQKLNETVTGLGFAEYTSTNKTMFDIFCITAALMFGTAGLPHVIVRFFTVPRAADARLSAGWALVFIALLYTVAPAVGSFARLNVISSVNETTYVPAAAYDDEAAAITERGDTPSPAWFANWEKTGLVGFDDINGDGRMQIRGPAAPDGLANEVTINNDIYVLANPEIARLPDWVIGLVVAGGLAAALSTAAGLLMVISSAISHDLCRRTFFKGMSDTTELRIARVAAAGAVVAAGFMGIYSAKLAFVAQVVAFAFGLAAASLFPVIFLGIFWKRMNREGAIAAMLTGLVPTFAYIWHFKLGAGKASTASDWFLGVSPEGIGFVFMFVALVIGIIVSLMTKAPPQDIQDLVEDIRVPGTRSPHGVADAGMLPVD
ncbi:sodium:solute symporter family protein [Hyphomonas sp.]|uniref:sodium:solute symporter family protein n=1 Tax=Hyphomonas sp. TaxID=87 RepID=UPI0032F000F4|tara:strand:- start:26533 stop:28311 length:1779 start_codon:yes stop_codon:yes gene_type:complete